jgi:hypothetical protein
LRNADELLMSKDFFLLGYIAGIDVPLGDDAFLFTSAEKQKVLTFP